MTDTEIALLAYMVEHDLNDESPLSEHKYTNGIQRKKKDLEDYIIKKKKSILNDLDEVEKTIKRGHITWTSEFLSLIFESCIFLLIAKELDDQIKSRLKEIDKKLQERLSKNLSDIDVLRSRYGVGRVPFSSLIDNIEIYDILKGEKENENRS